MAWELYDVPFGPSKEEISQALLFRANSGFGGSVAFFVVESETENEMVSTDWKVDAQSITRFDGEIWHIYGKVNDQDNIHHSKTIHIEYSFGTLSGRVLRLGTEVFSRRNWLPEPIPGKWEVFYWFKSNNVWMRYDTCSSEEEARDKFRKATDLLRKVRDNSDCNYAKSSRTYLRYPDGTIEGEG